ncbi:MAG: ATP-binding protein [Clostridia bacterium]|nr:ATP-binding protein [Clostridia bacterium]
MQLLNYNLEAQISFESDSIEKILALCEEAIESLTFDESARFKLKSAIHELVVNCIEHGYNKSSGVVTITFKKHSDSIFIEICDEGEGLDPSLLDTDRDIENIEAATPRGWGLMIISKFAREFRITSNTPRGTRISLYIPTQA